MDLPYELTSLIRLRRMSSLSFSIARPSDRQALTQTRDLCNGLHTWDGRECPVSGGLPRSSARMVFEEIQAENMKWPL